MVKEIVFVCLGNTCRSPVCEYLMVDCLKKENINSISVSSRGVSVARGGVMASSSENLLRKNGCYAGGFSSTQLSEEDLKKEKLILCVTKSVSEYIKSLYGAMENVYTFGQFLNLYSSDKKYFDINDPYLQGETAYKEMYDVVKCMVEELTQIMLTKFN